MIQDFEIFRGNYQEGQLQTTSKISYNVTSVIENNRALAHGKFENPDWGSGLEKIFYNIGWVYADGHYRGSNVNMKDLKVVSLAQENIGVAAFLRAAVYAHLKQTSFSTIIDIVRRDMINDGTALVKIVDGQIEVVDLLNVVIPPHVNSIQDSGLAEKVRYSWEKMKANKEEFKDHWEDIETLWEKMQIEKINEFTVYEWWTETVFGKDKKIHKGCIRFLDQEMLRPSNLKTTDTWNPWLELDRFITPHKRKRHSKRLAKKLGEYEELYPYKEVHFVKLKGRWLGFSVFELVAGLQEDYNERRNIKRKRDLLDLRGIYVHQKGVGGASLSQEFLDNADVGTSVTIEQGETLERLSITHPPDEFISLDKIFELGRQITGLTAQGTGEEVPAATTATVAIVNQKIGQTTADLIRDQLSIFISELFMDFYLETVIDELDEKEKVLLEGDNSILGEVDKLLVSWAIRREKTKYEQANFGIPPTPEMIQQAEQEIMQELKGLGSNRWGYFKKEMIDNFEYLVDFSFTSESFDQGTKVKNIEAMLARPTLTLSRKKLEEAELDLIGMDGKRFGKTLEEIEMEKQQQMMAGQPIVAANSGAGQFAKNNQP